MNQQLTLSKSIVHFLNDNLPTFRGNDALKTIDFIEQNFIVADNSVKHFNILLDEIQNIKNEINRQEIQKLFIYWVQEKKYLVNFNYGDSNYNEVQLAQYTEDKIYFNPSLETEKIVEYSKKFRGLEIHNLKTFIDPDHIHRLKHLPTIIPLQKNTRYDIVKLFQPFLKYAKFIRIEDPYLPNATASANLLLLIKPLRSVPISLIFLPKNEYIKAQNKTKMSDKTDIYDKLILEIENLISEGYKIDYSVHFKKKNHRERFIFTEDFQIYLPGGLDFLSIYGFLKEEDATDISEKKEIRIEERKFEINF